MPASRLNAARALCVLIIALVPLLSSGQDRHHPSVRAAFKPVVAEAVRSTAQVYGDGYSVALGAVVRADGYVITKASELKGKLEVQFYDQSRKFPAEIVATDAATDLALLKVDRQGLPVLAWAAESSPAVGSWLATTALNPSPLAIGVVSVGPRKVAAPAAALGIVLEDNDQSAVIEEVREGMAADKAGLEPGDIVKQVAGKPIRGRESLQQAIRSFQPDDKVEIVVERGGQQKTLQAVLGSMAQLMAGERAEFQNTLGGNLSKRRAGFPVALQHDTVLKPSECGGPIVDLDGKAVGLNIARAGRVESYALPAAVAREAIDKLLAEASPAADSKLVDKKMPKDGERKIQ